MNILRVLGLLLALPIIFAASSVWGAETVIVNKDFNNREIKVRTGAMIQVELQQAGATGYTWEIQDFDTEHFEVMSVKTRERPDNGDFAGAPVLRIWLIRTIKEGKARLKLIHFRPWEGEKSAVDMFNLQVRIL